MSKWTVYRWIEEGRLRATKIGGGSLRVFRASVNALIGEAEESGGRTDRKSLRNIRKRKEKP